MIFVTNTCTNIETDTYTNIDTDTDVGCRCLANQPTHIPPTCPPALARQTYLSIGLDVKTKRFQMKLF